MWPNAGSGTAQAYGSGEGYSLVSFFGKLNYSIRNAATAEARHRMTREVMSFVLSIVVVLLSWCGNVQTQIFEDELYYICHDGRELHHIRTEKRCV